MKKNIILIVIVIVLVIICILGAVIGFGLSDEPKDNDRGTVNLSKDLSDEDKNESSKESEKESESESGRESETTSEKISEKESVSEVETSTEVETTIEEETTTEEMTTTEKETTVEEETTTPVQPEKLDRLSYEYMIIDGKSVYAEYSEKIMDLYESINEARIKAGVSALTFDTDISYIACARASQIAYEEAIEGSFDVKYYTLMQKSGIVFSKAVENIAAGHEEAAQVVSGNDTSWKTSTTHYDNLISVKYTKVGVGVDYSEVMYGLQFFQTRMLEKERKVMTKKLRTEDVKDLFEAILTLEDVEECYAFFEDVCTVNEVLSIAQRFAVAKMLRTKETYKDIAEKTGASTATISRVNRALNYGNDGYDMVFERLKDK